MNLHRVDFEKLTADKFGIAIQEFIPSQLEDTISEACHKFNMTPKEYLTRLNTCPVDSPLWEYLVSKITIGESYFFRDERQMQLLSKTILPEIIDKKRKQKNFNIRIWSAGSSSGEEIYSVAILLNELLPDLNNWELDLLGTDINNIALAKAKKGHYKLWSMRAISDYLRNKYFKKHHNEYILDNRIKNLVKFSYLNLNALHYLSILNGTHSQDLILCRNVLIYFDKKSIEQIMDRFYKSLSHEGYLLLGASDPVLYPEGLPWVYHYRSGNLLSRTAERPQKEALSHPNRKNKSILNKLIAPSFVKKTPDPTLNVNDLVKNVKKLIEKSEWERILSVLKNMPMEKMNNAFLLNAKAISLANVGELDVALAVCQTALTFDGTNPGLYFTYALVLSELNRYLEAENAFRKALFLDHRFVMAHFQLGLLLMRNKDKKAGLKSLQNALSIAVSEDPSQEVRGVSGITYGKLADILNHELELGKNDE